MDLMLLSVDPGVRKAGVALFESSELTMAWLVRGSGSCETAAAVWASVSERVAREVVTVLAIEKPQVYEMVQIDNNDLIDLAIMVGATAAAGMVLTNFYFPRTWKGQTPKDVMIERIKGRLDSEERERVELPNEKQAQKDVWDAIGIGLYAVGRLAKRRK